QKRVGQIVHNLISNASKYGRGQPVEGSVERDGPLARLRVRDQGIGLTPEQQELVFQKFERAVSDRSSGGLGLGQWITREIVEALGGRIGVTSTPGVGSEFSVELPVEWDPRR